MDLTAMAQKLVRPGAREEDNRTRAEVRVSDFIPYACHYDKNTLLTKNGELVKTLKITGFTQETVGKKNIPLREAVRQAVLQSLDSDHYALWFHTIRRRKSLDPGGEFFEPFAAQLHKRWKQKQKLDDQFVNELYITVVREGQNITIRHPRDFLRALLPGMDRRYRSYYLKEAFHTLDATVHRMLESLQEFGAYQLGVIEKEGVFYSENLRFLSKIVNLDDRPHPAKFTDISDYLPSEHISFGYNALEVRSDRAQHFGTVLTVKEYKELSISSIDKFLQIPQEFVISQCIDFIHAEEAKGFYEYQQYLTEVSEDPVLGEISGLLDVLASDRNSPLDYGEQQLSILLLEPSLSALEQAVANALGALNELGIVAMREEVRLEECFWSLLPGNFEFITRLKPINTSRVAGFASLYNFPAGHPSRNHWGPAVTLLHTAAGTPYFFNFHLGRRGHTAIIGPHGAGKTVLLNFLCAEARKFSPRLFFFDYDRGSEIFLRSIGGHYHRIHADAKRGALQMNPLLLPDSENTRGFLVEWLWSLLTAHGDELNGQEIAFLNHIVGQLMGLPPAQRRLAVLAQGFAAQGQQRLVKLMAPWHSGGMYAFVFDYPADNLNLDSAVHGFEMGGVLDTDVLLKPVLEYLLYRISMTLDGTRTMVVLDEAWKMLDNELFAPKIHAWLDMLEEHNAFAIFATESADEASESAISADIMEHISTEIYFPNMDAGAAYQDVFRLSDYEYTLIRKTRPESRKFLLKHEGDAVLVSLDLSGMEDILGVLSANPQSIALMEKLLVERGHEPGKWLPVYQQYFTASGGRG